MEARAAVRAILDEYVVVPAVATVEEPDLKRRIAILRAKNEALRARLAWERKLEFTPRGVLRRTPFGPEELAIIRSIEPALAVRTVKDPSYDPFKNGYDLTWMRPDWKPPGLDEDEDDAKEGPVAAEAEAAERERDDEPRAEKAGAFAPAPPIALGHAAADARASSAYAPEQHHQHQNQHLHAVSSEMRRSPPSTSRPPRASAARRRLARLAAKRSPLDAVRSPAEDGLGFIDALIDDAVDDAVREEEEEETRAAARDASRRIEDAAEKDDEDDGSPRSPLQERRRHKSRYEALPKHLRKSLA